VKGGETGRRDGEEKKGPAESKKKAEVRLGLCPKEAQSDWGESAQKENLVYERFSVI